MIQVFVDILLLILLCSTCIALRSLLMRTPSMVPISIKPRTIYFYNTLSRQKELFRSNHPSKVTFYSCGPTVYDFAHIGNFRAFLTYDLIKRWLQYCGYDVDHVCNLTDVDDKIIVKMNSDGKNLMDITNKYTEAFFDDLKVLNIKLADRYPKVTEHIGDIENMIAKLIEKGHAYSTENGSVYFRVSSIQNYSKLTNINSEDMIDGAGGSGPNTRRGASEKEDQKDFVLWKSFVPTDGEVSWQSQFGKGRPGWHIECSAMCCRWLGETIDIHAGGIDLVFPHHQNEILQSEAYSGKIYSNFWLHNGFVNINNEKMSKSLRNFKTLRDIALSPTDARAFRYLIVSSQYRSPLNFSPETFTAAIQSLKRVDKLYERIKTIVSSNHALFQEKNEPESIEEEVRHFCDTILQNFEKAMSDDMNTPKAVAELFSLVSKGEKLMGRPNENVSIITANLFLQSLQKIDKVFGIFYQVPASYFGGFQSDKEKKEENIPEELVILASRRKEAKLSKDFNTADNLRQIILDAGYVVKDTKDGFELIKKT